MTLPKVGTILFLVSLSLYPGSELKAQPELEAKEAINFMEFLVFFMSQTINLPLLGNLGGSNSNCKLISTQLKEI